MHHTAPPSSKKAYYPHIQTKVITPLLSSKSKLPIHLSFYCILWLKMMKIS